MEEDLESMVHRISSEIVEQKRRLDKIEDHNDRHDKDIRTLFENHASTKVYVEQILASISEVKNQIFNHLMTLSSATQKDKEFEDRKDERDKERTDRQVSQVQWLTIIKYVIATAIGAVITIASIHGGVIK